MVNDWFKWLSWPPARIMRSVTQTLLSTIYPRRSSWVSARISHFPVSQYFKRKSPNRPKTKQTWRQTCTLLILVSGPSWEVGRSIELCVCPYSALWLAERRHTYWRQRQSEKETMAAAAVARTMASAVFTRRVLRNICRQYCSRTKSRSFFSTARVSIFLLYTSGSI